MINVFLISNDFGVNLFIEKAVKLDPRHAMAHYFIGEIYFGQEKWKNALAAYLRSADANPRDADAHAKICLCYLALNRSKPAKAALLRALQIDPQNETAIQIIEAELVK